MPYQHRKVDCFVHVILKLAQTATTRERDLLALDPVPHSDLTTVVAAHNDLFE
jgi:hypothetical protein